MKYITDNTSEKITICVKCTHCRRGRTPDWTERMCTSPELGRSTVVEPVSGEIHCFWNGNAPSGGIPTRRPYPLCMDINDGQCSRFKRKQHLLGRFVGWIRKAANYYNMEGYRRS